MAATVHYLLTNFTRGWSSFYTNPLDIRKIINIGYHKRLFCLWDPEYKYTATVTYYNPRAVSTVSPVITQRGHIGIAYTATYKDNSVMTVRYKTENEILQLIDDINKRKDAISKFDKQQNDVLGTFVNNTISA